MKVIIPVMVILLKWSRIYTHENLSIHWDRGNPIQYEKNSTSYHFNTKYLNHLLFIVRSLRKLAKGASVSKHKHPTHFSVSAVT